MLREIQSKVFKSHHQERPTIIFHEGLNVCKGPNDYPNSIGKSHFLLAIDFAFGGMDYIEKLDDVIKHVGNHDINFAHEFEGHIFYFSRNTANKNIVYRCNANYDKLDDSISIDTFTQWLKEKYEIKNELLFSDIVNRYFRIYGKENNDEMLPLKTSKGETISSSIIFLLKLFSLYSDIEKNIEEEKEANDMKTTFAKSQNYKYISKITKTQYNLNQNKINELKQQKDLLIEKASKNILELESEKLIIINNLKNNLNIFKRQESKYYIQLEAIKQNMDMNSDSHQNDFSLLQEFFPNTDLNVERLKEIEEFHKNLTTILKKDFKEAERKLQNLIELLKIQITNIENDIQKIENISNINQFILEKYSQINQEIYILEEQNNNYLQNEFLTKNYKTKHDLLIQRQMAQEEILAHTLNTEMAKINSLIFNEVKNSPTIHFDSTKTYTFKTDDDYGTGTNYKGLIIFDLACLKITDVPCLIHDSFLFKNISKDTMAKIIEIYEQAGYQIFIAIDNINNYNECTQQIINKNVVIELSTNGNELYGFKW